MVQSASCFDAQERRYIGFLCCISKESYCNKGHVRANDSKNINNNNIKADWVPWWWKYTVNVFLHVHTDTSLPVGLGISPQIQFIFAPTNMIIPTTTSSVASIQRPTLGQRCQLGARLQIQDESSQSPSAKIVKCSSMEDTTKVGWGDDCWQRLSSVYPWQKKKGRKGKWMLAKIVKCQSTKVGRGEWMLTKIIRCSSMEKRTKVVRSSGCQQRLSNVHL